MKYLKAYETIMEHMLRLAEDYEIDALKYNL